MEVSVLASGSTGNAIYIGNDRVKILVDCGISGNVLETRLQGLGISPEQLDLCLISHEHRDHTQGAGILSRKWQVPLLTTELTWAAIGDTIGGVDAACQVVLPVGGLEVEGMVIRPFSLSHDAADPKGFELTCGGRRVVVATDTGVSTEPLVQALGNVDLVILEANHCPTMVAEGPYPPPLKRRILGAKGHLSNATAGQLLAEAFQRRGRPFMALLAHLSEENNRPSRAMLQVAEAMKARGVQAGADIRLGMTYPGKRTPLYQVG